MNVTSRRLFQVRALFIACGGILLQFVTPWTQITGWALIVCGLPLLFIPLKRHLDSLKEDDRSENSSFWS
ncbi:hypothetical protein [Curtobacterium sp. S6]|uniref:hypothetical protein n=1 Tax=Curtobacterium sp. S6 TaxID=1479623 RepID=UPI0004ABBDFE|nr:hypothetical protein [Curtobacterium sp. S6]